MQVVTILPQPPVISVSSSYLTLSTLMSSDTKPFLFLPPLNLNIHHPFSKAPSAQDIGKDIWKQMAFHGALVLITLVHCFSLRLRYYRADLCHSL